MLGKYHQAGKGWTLTPVLTGKLVIFKYQLSLPALEASTKKTYSPAEITVEGGGAERREVRD